MQTNCFKLKYGWIQTGCVFLFVHILFCLTFRFLRILFSPVVLNSDVVAQLYQVV